MSDTTLETVLRRDRAVVLAALVAVAALAWSYVVQLATTVHVDPAAMDGMPGMSMPATEMVDTVRPGLRAWGARDFIHMFAMWAIMMVGMMLPSAAPMLLIYAGVARQAVAKGKPFAPTAWFAGGYLLAWITFAFVATLAQWALESALLLTPEMAGKSEVFGGAVLIGAGLYQWTSLKESCLSQCQSPLVFIQRHGGFQREPGPSLKLGAQHGIYCIGCCWALMALLFVGGVMNLLWIATIATIVLLEKIVPVGRWISRIVGAVLMSVGILLVISGV